MKKSILLTATLVSLLLHPHVPAQQPLPSPPQQQQRPSVTAEDDDEVVRITTELIQIDAVVVDKNEQPIADLRLEDFEVYEDGKKQALQFMEFVNVEGGPSAGGASSAVAKIAPGIDASVSRELAAKDVKRVIAFVVDDVTIPTEDLRRVRLLLSDFVDHKMQDGDLVAIVRTVGGKGLLEQFTTDRQILRRAIALLTPKSIPPYLAFSGTAEGRISSTPSPLSDTSPTETVNAGEEFEGPSEGTNQVPRAILALSVSNFLVDSLRQIPGRKSLVLVSGGLPLFDLSRSGSIAGDLTQVFRQLTDNATRSGVVINTLDVRGLTTAGAVARYADTPGRSAMGGGTFAGDDTNTLGRGPDLALLGDRSPTDQLGLRALAGATGGVSVVNSNNFSTGLERVLNRSRAYYRLAYRPSERFDNKFHKHQVKVRRSGARVYAAEGYYARADRTGGTRSKEEEIVAAARSPLAVRGLEVSADLGYRYTPNNQAQLDINTLIDVRKLSFTRSPEGKYQTTLDIIGFVYDQLGRSRGGISQTVNADLSEESYRRALATGIGYTASTQLPPGYYQVRLVVREAGTGRIGSVSRYFEVADLSRKQLTLSSLFLYAADPTAGGKTAPEPLPASRVVSRKQDLRYAAVIYNGKLSNNKPQLRSRLIVSQGDKVLFQEPEQPVVEQGNSSGQVVKVGQLGLAKVSPGRYVLTLVITDPLADKKRQTVARSVDFTVVN